MNKIEHVRHHSARYSVLNAFHTILDASVGFVRKNPVLTIAAALAIATSFIVTPDIEYLGYFDFRTLTCLLCTLAVICALKEIRFFYVCAERIIGFAKNLRLATIALVYITFIGSMLIANDMALITFLPLGYIVLSCTKNEKYMVFVFILQNIAANLGGMLTPFGNPQNLYLYSYFEIPAGQFVSVMFPPFIFAMILITLACFIVPSTPLSYNRDEYEMPKRRLVVYLALFALSILVVFRGIPYQLGLIVIPTALFFLDRKALREVDWGLLMTFVCFFIFSGNMARIPAVEAVIGTLVGGSEKLTLLTSSLSCQAISNVPSAILLSKFTVNWKALLYGVNIGGCGTLISSLASLITFRTFMSHNRGVHGAAGKYVAMFSVVNFAMLGLLLALCMVLV
ncbi:MAG: citrate transporter [Ruminococcaceae bacterium]|nr:citrate transporter [Oscillospiraceae bacterium]